MVKYCYPLLIYKEVGGWLCVFLVFLNRKKYLFLKIIALKMNLILFFSFLCITKKTNNDQISDNMIFIRVIYL